MNVILVYAIILSAGLFDHIKSDVEYIFDLASETSAREYNNQEIQNICSSDIGQFLKYFDSEIDLNRDASFDKYELYESYLRQKK